MKNLIVCCDGTWNSPDNEDDGALAPTNVFKLFNAVDLEANTKQLSRYQAGVGTGGLLDKVTGGALGFGLGEDIRDCYQWLSLKYQPGDNIYLFGFSRGAFSARSLAGMIGKFGIADPAGVGDLELQVKKIYRDGYRNKKNISNINFHPNSNKVKFVGVWDTVGALGIPNDKILLNLFDNASRYKFHDTKLGEHIEFARHAVAIDEKRGSFTPTLWDVKTNNDKIKQVWFPGVHSDVGGGYKESGLADCALKWMIEEATNKGIVFQDKIVKHIKPNPYDIKHESHVGLMKALITAPRSIPKIGSINKFSQSTRDRRNNPPINQAAYLPVREFKDNSSITLDIYAKQNWNWTGIYLEANQKYNLSATGQWTDSSISSGPEGMSDGKFHVGEIAQVAGSVLGWLESGLKKIGLSEDSDVIGSKRVEHADWFALVGAIADGGNPDVDGTHDTLTHFEIGSDYSFTPKKSGYLYCFANDAWGFYQNNRGFVTLTIEKV